MIELAATAVAFLDARLLELCGRTESEYKWHVLYQVRHYYQVAQVQDFEQIAENNTCNINGVVRTSLCYARSFSICSANVYPKPFEGEQRNEGGWLVLTILWRVFRC